MTAPRSAHTRAAVTLTLLLAAGEACAASQAFSDYVVHYSSFSSLLIPAFVAEQHGIVRSDRRLVTNVAVQRDGKPVRASVSGHARNLLNQLIELDFDEVQERTAIYYLASLVADERDTLYFTISIKPLDSAAESFTLEYQRRF